MTLIVGVLFHGCMFHASDRLTTTHSGTRPWDENANKVVIVLLDEVPAILGFTGTAYLEDVPTDTWLASKAASLTSTSAGTLAPGLPALAGLGPHAITERIAGALRKLALRMPTSERRALHLETQMIYMRRVSPRHRRPRGGAFHIRCTGSDVTVAHYPASPSWWAASAGRPAAPFVQVVPDHRGVTGAIRSKLLSIAESATPAAFMEGIVSSVVAASEVVPGIGSEVLSVELLPATEPAFVVDFVPVPGAVREFAGPVRGVPERFSPWYISRNGWMPPRVATPLEMGVGGDPLYVRIAGGTSQLPMMLGARDQPRRGGPTSRA